MVGGDHMTKGDTVVINVRLARGLLGELDAERAERGESRSETIRALLAPAIARSRKARKARAAARRSAAARKARYGKGKPTGVDAAGAM